MEGSQGSLTLCDENGVLQVGEQRVLIVTLVPEKHQETGEREGTAELGRTQRPAGRPGHPPLPPGAQVHSQDPGTGGWSL